LVKKRNNPVRDNDRLGKKEEGRASPARTQKKPEGKKGVVKFISNGVGARRTQLRGGSGEEEITRKSRVQKTEVRKGGPKRNAVVSDGNQDHRKRDEACAGVLGKNQGLQCTTSRGTGDERERGPSTSVK